MKRKQKNVSILAQEKYLVRFIYGKVNKKPGDIHLVDNIYNNSSVVSRGSSFSNNVRSVGSVGAQQQALDMQPKNLSYPLPVPGYGGHRVTKLHIFVGGTFLLGPMNMHTRSYILQISLGSGS